MNEKRELETFLCNGKIEKFAMNESEAVTVKKKFFFDRPRKSCILNVEQRIF